MYKFRVIDKRNGTVYGEEYLGVKNYPHKGISLVYFALATLIHINSIDIQLYTGLDDVEQTEIYIGDILACAPPFKTWVKTITYPIVFLVDYLDGEYILRDLMAKDMPYICSLSSSLEHNEMYVIGRKYQEVEEWGQVFFNRFKRT